MFSINIVVSFQLALVISVEKDDQSNGSKCDAIIYIIEEKGKMYWS